MESIDASPGDTKSSSANSTSNSSRFGDMTDVFGIADSIASFCLELFSLLLDGLDRETRIFVAIICLLICAGEAFFSWPSAGLLLLLGFEVLDDADDVDVREAFTRVRRAASVSGLYPLSLLARPMFFLFDTPSLTSPDSDETAIVTAGPTISEDMEA
jgi:hypothetical protein